MTEGRRKLSDARWKRRFSELEEYIRAHGSAAIRKSDTAHRKLRGWLQEQRNRAKTGSLDAERMARLTRLGVVKRAFREWNGRFQRTKGLNLRRCCISSQSSFIRTLRTQPC